MRITNNMIMHNTSNNINGNKVNVDKLNNQMSSQKKIQRPSEDPVIAVRALRLRSALSQVNQYYQRNIPDAESWLSVTDTAIYNMETLVRDIRSEAVYGAGDDLKESDRQAILEQMQKLREQVYAEGNTDYAGRTVFTGFHTNKKLTFMTNEKDTTYNITQNFTYKDIEEHRYYSGDVTIPNNAQQAVNDAISEPQESIYKRIRLSYGKVSGNAQDPGDNMNPVITYTTQNMTTPTQIAPTIYDNYKDWEAASANGYDIPAGGAVFIKDSGELILSDELASDLKGGKADISISYQKTGFNEGELRPEYYYNCTDVTDTNHPIEYTKFDENGNEIYQDMKFTVASNQTLTVNTNASDVFDAALGRDMDEMITAVQRSIDAHQKLTDLKAMKKMDEYADPEAQERLDKWITAVSKECDYADDNMQELYNSCIGKCDKYLEKIELAQTVVGSKGKTLELVKKRMSQQQTTIEELKSTNEDRELSDIIIDYTAAYNAYSASLQAAAKANQSTLLNYI